MGIIMNIIKLYTNSDLYTIKVNDFKLHADVYLFDEIIARIDYFDDQIYVWPDDYKLNEKDSILDQFDKNCVPFKYDFSQSEANRYHKSLISTLLEIKGLPVPEGIYSDKKSEI